MRASTRRQAEAQAIDQPIRRLRAHARDRGREPPGANAFRDDGYSGATPRRPGLDRLRDAAAMAAFDAILLTDPVRPARIFALRGLLLGERQARGRRVESLDRPTSRDPHDRLLLRIRGAVAEYERAPIAGRTRRGRRRRHRAGEMLPRAPCGYRTAADRPRGPEGAHLDPAEAGVVADMFTWYSEGRRTPHGPVDHLRDLGVPAPSGEPRRSDASARGISRDPAYAGRAYAGRHTCREARARRSAAHPIGRPHGAAEPTPRRVDRRRPDPRGRRPGPARPRAGGVGGRPVVLGPQQRGRGPACRAAWSAAAAAAWRASRGDAPALRPLHPHGQVPRGPGPGRGRPAARVTSRPRPWTSWPGGPVRPPAAPRGGPRGVPPRGGRGPAPAGVPGEARAVASGGGVAGWSTRPADRGVPGRGHPAGGVPPPAERPGDEGGGPGRAGGRREDP